jgi:nicotinate-nucleotide adenylyltransferase|tara:strand:- start:118 stop:672 length:555 start_codon:yes stop_codon:yes gene_type:complete
MFGGSFDPPHLAHIEMVNHIIGDCDKFYIFPVKESPNKVNHVVATSNQRLEMCRLSFQPISPKIEISNFELIRLSPSYTINTARWILNQFPDCDLTIIIGEDQGAQLTTWYEFEALKKLVSIICFSRTHFEVNSEIELEYIHDFNHELSSTKLRSGLIDDLRKVKSMLNPHVFDYIQKNKLYSC